MGQAMVALFRRELAGYLYSPLGWVVMTLFLAVQGYGFYLVVELLSRPLAPHGAVMQFFFGGTFYYWLFLIVLVSTITMRLLAEERRAGTIETLMTAPVTASQVVVGKYLAALCFYALLWLPTGIYLAVLGQIAGRDAVSLGPVLSGYLGTLLLGAACIAIGLFASAIARTQIVAALLTFAALSLLMLLGPLSLFVRSSWLSGLIDYINLFDHMEDFSRGIVDSRHLVFYVSVVFFSLWLATLTLERRKWRVG